MARLALSLATFAVLRGSAATGPTIKTGKDIDKVAREVGVVKQVTILDTVDIFAMQGTSDAAVVHAANIVAQYLDNDEDGALDDPQVAAALRSVGAAMLMTETEDDWDFDAMFGGYSDRKVNAFEDAHNFQSLYDEETKYAGNDISADGAIEEVLHLITGRGYAVAYPDVWGEEPGSSVADAIDEVMGDCEASWQCDGGCDEEGDDEDGDGGHDHPDEDGDGGHDHPDEDGDGGHDHPDEGSNDGVPNGEDACEGKGLKESQCLAVGCCMWDDGECWSAVGKGECQSRRLDETAEDACEGGSFQGHALNQQQCLAVGCCEWDLDLNCHDGHCHGGCSSAGKPTAPCRPELNGEEACENKGLTKTQCSAVGCCEWGDGECWSSVGTATCQTGPKPKCTHYSECRFVEGSCSGAFHYADRTCDSRCLVTEGLYWALTAKLGYLESRCADIADEWKACTPALVASLAPALDALIDASTLAKVLPDGTYSRWGESGATTTTTATGGGCEALKKKRACKSDKTCKWKSKKRKCQAKKPPIDCTALKKKKCKAKKNKKSCRWNKKAKACEAK